MLALILLPFLLGCTIPPTTITPTEARSLAMLHQLKAMDPCEADPICREVRRNNAGSTP